MVLLRLLRLLVPTLVLMVAILRAITIIGSVVAVASVILLWVALGVRLLLVIILSLLVVFTVTRAVFSHTLACAFRLAIAVIDAIILHIVTATILLILLVNIWIAFVWAGRAGVLLILVLAIAFTSLGLLMCFWACAVVIVEQGQSDGHRVASLLLSATIPYFSLTTSGALDWRRYCWSVIGSSRRMSVLLSRRWWCHCYGFCCLFKRLCFGWRSWGSG